MELIVELRFQFCDKMNACNQNSLETYGFSFVNPVLTKHFNVYLIQKRRFRFFPFYYEFNLPNVSNDSSWIFCIWNTCFLLVRKNCLLFSANVIMRKQEHQKRFDWPTSSAQRCHTSNAIYSYGRRWCGIFCTHVRGCEITYFTIQWAENIDAINHWFVCCGTQIKWRTTWTLGEREKSERIENG